MAEAEHKRRLSKPAAISRPAQTGIADRRETPAESVKSGGEVTQGRRTCTTNYFPRVVAGVEHQRPILQQDRVRGSERAGGPAPKCVLEVASAQNEDLFRVGCLQELCDFQYFTS
jgi:hypothetical protein